MISRSSKLHLSCNRCIIPSPHASHDPKVLKSSTSFTIHHVSTRYITLPLANIHVDDIVSFDSFGIHSVYFNAFLFSRNHSINDFLLSFLGNLLNSLM